MKLFVILVWVKGSTKPEHMTVSGASLADCVCRLFAEYPSWTDLIVKLEVYA